MEQKPWDGTTERRRGVQEFCQAHIPMSNSIVRIETSLINIEKALTQGITFKTAIVGTIVMIVVAIIGQAVLYGKLLEKVDGMKTFQTELKQLTVSQAEDRQQIKINTERWNRLLERNPVIIQNTK
jgi:hypothetical protein